MNKIIKMNNIMEINIKLNEEIIFNSLITMDFYNLYVKNQMAQGQSEFQASINFLMDENVPDKYKEKYRRHCKQECVAMDTDDAPDPPKLVRQNAHSKSYY
jgi:hypothetical protein